MPQRLNELASEIVRLQGELDREIKKRHRTLGWSVNEKLVEFEHGLAIEHRRVRRSVSGFLKRAPIGIFITAPIIYSLIIPIAIADLWVSAYQAVCFRGYGVPQVKRSDYLVFDRRHLAYLNWLEVLNCVFCEYANGVIGYVREVAARTEQFWCPIKHALKVVDPHARYQQFVEYGDADGYRERLNALREALRAEGAEAKANPPT
jgi:hypothetical protein